MRGFILHAVDCSAIGDAVEVSHEQLLAAPDEGWQWTEVPLPAGAWTVALVDGSPQAVPFEQPPEVALMLARGAVRAAINARREAVILGGCMAPNGHRVDTDETSRNKLTGAVLSAMLAKQTATPLTIYWTMADNVTAPHDADEVIALGVAVAEFVAAAHGRALALKAELEAAADVAAVEAIDIASGWPA